MQRKIIQLVPANGWKAMYRTERDGGFVHNVICFALTENAEGERTVEGIRKRGKETVFCEDDADFTGYAPNPGSRPG